MAKPSEVPEWATDATYDATGDSWDGAPTKVDPGAALKAEGWEPTQQPPAEFFNWWKNLVGQWLSYVDGLGHLRKIVSLQLGIHVEGEDELDASGQDTAINGLAWRPNGSRVYLAGGGNNKVYQYDLSTPFDLSTASYVGGADLDASSQDTNIEDVAISSDGAHLYLVGNTNDKVYQYNLSTPFDLSTASYAGTGNDLDVSGQDTGVTGLAFGDGGAKLYVTGSDFDNVYQYNLSTPWDLSTASYVAGNDLSVSNEEGSPQGVEPSADGARLYVVGQVSHTVYRYDLTTPWDLSTASYSGESLAVNPAVNAPTGLRLGSEEGALYVCYSSDDKVRTWFISRLTSY